MALTPVKREKRKKPRTKEMALTPAKREKNKKPRTEAVIVSTAENKKANLCGRGGMLLEKEIHKLEKEKQILAQLKEKIENMLNTAPEGGLVIRTKRGKPQYYWSRAGKAESYIKYNQIDFIKKLAQKSYFVNLQKHITNQLQAIQSFLESYSQISIDDIYEQLPNKRKELVDPIVLTDEQYRKQWQESHYTGKGRTCTFKI